MQVVQVILNLALNGVEAMAATGERSGCLTIETRADSTQGELIVSDTGPGLSPEAEERVFEPTRAW